MRASLRLTHWGDPFTERWHQGSASHLHWIECPEERLV